MRQETVNIFTFDGLSDDAKENARDWYRENSEYHWVYEWAKSMEVFCEKFPIKVIDYTLDPFTHTGFDSEFTGSEELKNLSGKKLADYLIENFGKEYIKGEKEGNCSLTGYCGDASLFDELFNYIEKPDDQTNYELLLEMCITKWHKDCETNMEFQTTDEYIDASIIANEYEFTEDGTRYISIKKA